MAFPATFVFNFGAVFHGRSIASVFDFRHQSLMLKCIDIGQRAATSRATRRNNRNPSLAERRVN